MDEEFHSIIKLISGEEILALACVDENDGDPVITLKHPIIVKMIANNRGMYIKVKPWVELSDEETFIIKGDKVLTMTETKNKKLIALYNNYISEDDSQLSQFTGQVKPSQEMGYLASVDDSRKKLEELFKLNLNNKES
tara:strand:+ start:192 stop:605 length:414 start_codon:yes stop_codon:yes gene_type:complete